MFTQLHKNNSFKRTPLQFYNKICKKKINWGIICIRIYSRTWETNNDKHRKRKRNTLYGWNEDNSMSWMTNDTRSDLRVRRVVLGLNNPHEIERDDLPGISHLSALRPALEWRKRAREGLKQELSFSFRFYGRTRMAERRRTVSASCLRESALTLSWAQQSLFGTKKKSAKEPMPCNPGRVLPCPLTFRGTCTEMQKEIRRRKNREEILSDVIFEPWNPRKDDADQKSITIEGHCT